MKQSGHFDAQASILELIKDSVKEPILDLACGSGFLMKLLQKDFNSISANDFSKEMVDITARKLD